jgi:hypothetical protein
VSAPFDPTNIADADLDEAAAHVVNDQAPIHDAADADLDAAAQSVTQQNDADKISALDTLFRASTFRDGDQHARVLQLARTTGAPTDIVEANIDGFGKAADAAGWNPQRFYDENPVLSQILLERPNAAPVVLRTNQLDAFQRLGSYMRQEGWRLGAALLPGIAERVPVFGDVAKSASGYAPQIAADEAARRDGGEVGPRVVTPQEDLTGIERVIGRGATGLLFPASPEDRAKAIASGEAVLPPYLDRLNDVFDETIERGAIGAALVYRKLAPQFVAGEEAAKGIRPPPRDTYDLEKRKIDLENRGSVQKTYGEGVVEGSILKAIDFLPWMGATAVGTAAGGVVGLPLLGGFATNFGLLWGNSYLDVRDQPIDAIPFAPGATVDDGTALAASGLYALLQAGIQTQAFHDIAQAWGPLGEMVRQGNTKAFTEALLRDATLRNLVVDWGKRALTQSNAMAREMALQTLLSDTTGYLARNVAGHGAQVTEWNAPDVIEGGVRAAQSAWSAYQGSLVMSVGGGASTVVAHSAMVGDALRDANSDKAIEKVRALLAFAKGNKALEAIPDVVARLIREESADTGVPVEKLWMDARALPLLFQAEGGGGYGGDWEPVARGLGGDRLVTDIKAALVSGDKIPVPLEDFVAKWATKPLLMQTIGDDLTTQPYYQTAREKAETRAQRQQEVTQLANELLKTETPAQSPAEARLVTAVQDGARAAGLGEQEIQKTVALWRAFVRTQVAEFNRSKAADQHIDADTLFDNAAVQVRRGSAGEVQVVDEGAGTLNPAPAPTARAEPGTTESLRRHLDNNDPNARTQELPKLTPEDLARPAPTQGGAEEPASDVQGLRHAVVVTPQLPHGEPVRYDVVEADTLIPSHTHNFGPHPDFPAGVQERNYQQQPEEQFKVIAGAGKLNPAFLLADTPSALDGPPLVTEGPKRLVLGGNGRTMMIQRAFSDPAKVADYKAALLRKASAFGVSPTEIEGMKAPVLVRTVGLASDAPKEALIAGVRRFNEGMTQKLSEKARALAEAKTMSLQTVQDLGSLFAADDNATLRTFMREHPNDVVGILRRDGIITPQNQTEWLQGGELTDAAKDRLEGMFLGRVIESEVRLNASAPSMLAKVERIAPSLLRVAGVNKQFDITDRVRAAIDILNELQQRKISMEELLAQPPLLGPKLNTDPFTVAMARLLDGLGPRALQARFKSWAEYTAPDPQRDLFRKLAPPPTEVGAQAILLQGAEPSLFQRDTKNLIVQHNLNARDLLHADELGGLAMPSIAIGRVEHPLVNFGEITMLGRSDLVDPKAGVPVFDADAFTPRHPTTVFKVDRKRADEAFKKIGDNLAGAVGTSDYEFEKALRNKGLGLLEHAADNSDAVALRAAFLSEKGILPPQVGKVDTWQARSYIVDTIDRAGLEPEFQKWAKDLLEPAIGDRVIEKTSFTWAGDRRVRRIPATLENLVREMRKEPIRGADSGGLGAARAKGAKQFRSIGGIQADRDKIAAPEDVRKAIAAIDDRFGHLVDALNAEVNGPGSGSSTTMDMLDRTASTLGDSYRVGITRALTDNGMDPAKVSDATKIALHDLAHDLVRAPTDYFEAKPKKAVPLSSFVAAVVPKGIEPEVRDVLKKHGIKIYDHQQGPDEEVFRAEAIAKAAQDHDLLFQREPPAVPGLLDADEARQTLGAAWNQSAGQAAVRGWTQRLRDGAKRVFNIVLTEHANLSTFVHESGHVFLELMGDLAERPDAPERLKEDWKAALDWLGVQRRQDIGTPQHEKWARTFEDYLKNDTAPSGTLVRTFQRFRLWLSSIYGAAKQVPGSDIDPEISGIFDRMLATDREIENQSRAAGFDQPLFSTAAEAGMSPEQFRDYLDSRKRALSHAAEVANVRTLKDRQRETEAAWKEEASKIQTEVEKEYDARPDVRAYRLLRHGDPGDEPALAALGGNINRLSLMRDLKDAPPELRDAVLKKLIGRVANEGEVIPADIARVLGFNSTVEMMQAVVGAPRKVDWVKEQVAQRMADKHGDIVREREKLADLVGKALHQKPTLDWLMREYEALRRRTVPGDRGQPAPMIESLRIAAEALVGRTPIWDLSASKVLGLERKAGEDAFKALANAEFKRALVAKQQQLLNALTHNFVAKAIEARDEFHALLERVTNDKARGNIGKAGPEYLAGIDRLTEAMGVKKAPAPEEDAKRATFDQVLDRMVADGYPAAFDVEVVRQAIADGPDPSKVPLTVDTMREVDAAIRQIRKIATDTLFVMKLDQRMSLDELLADINSEAAASNAQKVKPPASYSAAPWWWPKYETAQAVNAALTDPQYMFEKLGKTANDFFWRGWTRSRDVESELQKKVTREVLKLWDHVPKQDRARRNELLPEDVLPLPADVNRDVHYRDRNWLLMVALNMGNASNKERLLGGYGWNEKQVIDALQKHLTHGEMEFVQKVWNLLDKELYPALAAHYEKVNGIPPEEDRGDAADAQIDGETKTYDGGYFPAKYDAIAGRSGVGVRQEDAAIAQLYGSNGAATSVARGFTKERARRFNDVVNLQWSVLPAHVLDVVHYTAVDGFVRDAFKAMNERRFRDAVQQYLGPKYEPQLDQWLRVVASARAEEAPKSLEGILSILSPLRNRYMTAVVGANVTTMLAHATIPLEAVFTREVKPTYGAISMLQAMTGAGWLAQRRQALEKSPQLRDMSEQARHRLDVALAEAGGRNTPAQKARRFIDEASHYGFDVVLKLTSTVIWDARYRQELARQG